MTHATQLKTSSKSNQRVTSVARARVLWYSTLVLVTTLAEACFLASTVQSWY